MSLGIAFKGPEGIVLAADSRVTLTAMIQDSNGQSNLLPATFDNATKLLRFSGNVGKYVGAVTYGAGAMGTTEPRTAHSFLPEFEGSIDITSRLTTIEFAEKFSNFMLKHWKKEMPEDYQGPDMVFLLGGFDQEDIDGKVYRFGIPSTPAPEELNEGRFGLSWGGQVEFTSRLIHGYDPKLIPMVKEILSLKDDKVELLQNQLMSNLNAKIPYQFLPLQDCVDLSIFLIRTTRELQKWIVDVRGVGGAIDVATISRTKGFEPVQVKEIKGDQDVRY